MVTQRRRRRRSGDPDPWFLMDGAASAGGLQLAVDAGSGAAEVLHPRSRPTPEASFQVQKSIFAKAAALLKTCKLEDQRG